MAEDKRILAGVSQIRVEIADVAFVVVEGAQLLDTQPQIQSQIIPGFPIVLPEIGKVVGAVFVVVDPAAAEAEVWRTYDELLEIRRSSRTVDEKELAIEYLGKSLSKFTRVNSPPKRSTC